MTTTTDTPRGAAPAAGARGVPAPERVPAWAVTTPSTTTPRPIDTAVAAQKSGGRGPGGSPTSERRSIFRENV